MTQPLLSVENLCTHFRGEEVVKAVDGVSFDLAEGETLGIVGESGSGKSVTSLSILRLLARTARIEQGAIAYLGRYLVGLPEKEMRKIRGGDIGMIFQEPMTSLNPVFSVGAQVIEAIRLHRRVSRKQAKIEAIRLFEEVGIPDAGRRVNDFPHQMSGGQKQRVMIAMAFACNPKLLIADEPTTALDVTIQAQILGILRRLRDERGMSILFITHDLGVIAEIADRVIVMYQGKVVESGDTTDLFKNPQHPYTRGLLACRPRLDSQSRRLPTVSDFLGQTSDESTAAANTSDSSEEQNQPRHRLLHPPSAIAKLGFDVAKLGPAADFVAETDSPLLQVRGLQVHFPIYSGLFGTSNQVLKAVNGIDFDIYRGQTLGLVGESGCGKTTTGRAILRLQEPTAGEVCFDGTDIASLQPGQLRAMRKRMQIIFQDPYGSLNPRMNVEQLICEPMVIQRVGVNAKERRERAARLIQEVGLSVDYLRRYPHEFSGGQRQRISIARALSVEPEFIVCDESVSALDVSVQAQVLNLLKDLQEVHGLTYLFISHDLAVVKFMADMIAVMNQGQLLEFGPAEEVYQQPRDAYTRKLIEATPRDTLQDIEARQAERLAARR